MNLINDASIMRWDLVAHFSRALGRAKSRPHRICLICVCEDRAQRIHNITRSKALARANLR